MHAYICMHVHLYIWCKHECMCSVANDMSVYGIHGHTSRIVSCWFKSWAYSVYMYVYIYIHMHTHTYLYNLYMITYMAHLSGCSFLASPGFGDQLIALAFEPQPQGTQHPEQCPKGSRLRNQGRGPSWNQLTLQFRVHQGLGERWERIENDWNMVDG